MPVPVVVSGASGAGLEATAARWAGFLRDQQDQHEERGQEGERDRRDQDGRGDGAGSGGSGVSVVDVGVAAGAGRAGLEHRAVVLARDTAELAGLLEEVAGGREPSGVVRGVASGDPGVVFAFPGQGTQWVGMGARLLAESPVFASRLAECAQALGPFVDFDVLAVARGDAGAASLERVEVVQPVSWAVMVSLAAVWEAVGVRPSAVVGHSQGEVAAACVAGVLSLADGARVVAERSRIIAASLSGAGAMAAVALSPEQVQERLDADPAWGGVSVAAVNGPASVVVSGGTAAVENLVHTWQGQGVRVRRIAVDYASHSVQVEQVREELIAALDGIVPGAGRVPFYSTVRGEVVAGGELGAQYWYWNLRLPVGFAGVVEQLVSEGRGVVVEVSAHPVLGVGVQEIVEAAGGTVVGSLRRGEGGLGRFLESVGRVFVCGVGVDWPAVFAGSGGRGVAGLPTYAFQRRRFWLEGGARAGSGSGSGVVGHPLVGSSVVVAGSGEAVLSGRISVAGSGWVADHGVGSVVVFPGAGWVELAVCAGGVVGVPVVEELALLAPLVLPGAATEAGVGVPSGGGGSGSAGSGSGSAGGSGSGSPGSVDVQVRVLEAGSGSGGRRGVEMYARPTPTRGRSNANGQQQDQGNGHERDQYGNGDRIEVRGGDEEDTRGRDQDGDGDRAGVDGGGWVCHARGVLAPDDPATPDASGMGDPGSDAAGFAGGVWPPAGAREVELAGLYGELADRGYGYGPAFQGLMRAWRRGGEVFAEVELAEAEAEQAHRFGVHPALLDAALHASS
ncbi:acyltransferase domain-containing protein, partial [Murinocardiopsis flavida]